MPPVDTPLGSPTPPPATPPAGTPPAAPTLTAAPEWAKDWNVAPEVGDWMSKSGLKTPADFASSFMATKKLVGHDPANIIVKPKEGDSTAMMAALRGLGAQEKPEGYELKAGEGQSQEFLDTAAGWFAELGVPKALAAGLVERWNKYAGETDARMAAEFDKTAGAEVTALMKEWGGEFDRNKTAAVAARDAAGLTPEQGRAIEQAIGVGAATKMFAKLGEHLVEAKFKGAGPGAAFGTDNPEAARAELQALRGDKAFVARWNAGDVEARKKIAELDAIIAAAMPDPATTRAPNVRAAAKV